MEATGDRAILLEEIDGARVVDRLEAALEYLLKHRFDEDHGLVWGATTVDWGDVQPEHEWGVELDESSHRAIDVYDNAMLVWPSTATWPSSGDEPERVARWTARPRRV